MRSKLIILILSFFLLFYSSRAIGEIIVVTLPGALSDDIHNVVKDCAHKYGLTLSVNSNWLKDKGGWREDWDARRVRNKINRLARINGNDKSELSLLVVGKSAGGVLAWNTFKRHYSEIDDFKRVALVMVDPHGSVRHDNRAGPYKKWQDLWWPSNWLADKEVFRVYNIYQQRVLEKPNLTGASFPDRRVHTNLRLSDTLVDHMNITQHSRTQKVITNAISFLDEVTINIIVHNTVGRSTFCCNGSEEQEITFHLEITGITDNADIQISRDDIVLGNYNLKAEDNASVPLPSTRGSRILISASSGRERAEKFVYLDYNPPTFANINVNRSNRSVTFYADRVRDDGYWDSADYEVSVTVDNGRPTRKSGTAVTFENVSLGSHTATMRIKDGCGRWSSARRITFMVEENLPNLAFVSPGANAQIRRGSDLEISIEASDSEGIMRASIYLDRVSDDEFDNTMICVFPGIFGVDRPERKSCNVRANWSAGSHRLIAIAVDNSRNTRRVERVIRVIQN